MPAWMKACCSAPTADIKHRPRVPTRKPAFGGAGNGADGTGIENTSRATRESHISSSDADALVAAFTADAGGRGMFISDTISTLRGARHWCQLSDDGYFIQGLTTTLPTSAGATELMCACCPETRLYQALTYALMGSGAATCNQAHQRGRQCLSSSPQRPCIRIP